MGGKERKERKEGRSEGVNCLFIYSSLSPGVRIFIFQFQFVYIFKSEYKVWVQRLQVQRLGYSVLGTASWV